MTISERLLCCPLFEGVAATELTGMLRCLGSRRRSYARGDVILPEGSPALELGVLVTGQAQLIRTDYDGNRSILMHINPGQLFAESFACARAERMPVSVVAAEDSDVLLLECRRLLTTCSHACAFHRRVILNLLQIVAEKNLSLHRKALITARRTTRDKLMTYLLLQAKDAGGASFTIPFDRQALADYLEVDRTGLSAEMSKLKKEGLLDYYKNSFRLLDVPEGLHLP